MYIINVGKAAIIAAASPAGAEPGAGAAAAADGGSAASPAGAEPGAGAAAAADGGSNPSILLTEHLAS